MELNSPPQPEQSPIRTFNIEIAARLDINAACVYEEIRRWCEYNADRNDGTVHIEGKFWMYTSAQRIQARFPFMSLSTVERALKKLSAAGFIHKRKRKGSPAENGNPQALLYHAPEYKKPYRQNDGRGTVKMTEGGYRQNDGTERKKLRTNKKNKSNTPPNPPKQQPATPDQIAYIERLTKTRNVPQDIIDELKSTRGNIERPRASVLIERIEAAPYKTSDVPQPPPEELKSERRGEGENRSDPNTRADHQPTNTDSKRIHAVITDERGNTKSVTMTRKQFQDIQKQFKAHWRYHEKHTPMRYGTGYIRDITEVQPVYYSAPEAAG
jgi:hypothetical protein